MGPGEDTDSPPAREKRSSTAQSPVGGRLANFWYVWGLNHAEDWTILVLRHGYRIPFLKTPPKSNVPITASWYQEGSEHFEVLDQQISEMHSKAATEIVTDNSPGFYSRLFVVPKSSGGWRPIIDLSPLNQFIPKFPFRMETPATIRSALRPGDWLTSIDLKDAYFHVPIHKASRPYLRFLWRKKKFQFRALCFGLSTAPYLFTRVFRLISALAHSAGFRLYRYLDDWLIAAQSSQEVQRATNFVLQKCLELGLQVNFQKSELIPTQQAVFLGMEFETVSFTVRPSKDRLSRLDAVLKLFLRDGKPTAQQYLRLLGHMISLEKLIPLARLRIRPIQFFLADSWSTEQDMLKKIPRSTKILSELLWWSDEKNLLQGQRINEPQPDYLLHTDASKTGWGAHLNHLQAQGLWSKDQRAWHINALEMEALWLGLQAFLDTIRGSSVIAMTDNTTVVAQVRNQGGTQSRELTQQTTKVLLWAQENEVSLKARHIPGKRNVIADQLSRADRNPPGEWSLNQNVCEQLWKIWGRPLIDLFATEYNNSLPLYYSPVTENQSAGLDGLSQTWNGIHGYAYPPTPLITAVLKKVEQSEQAVVTLVAPRWPSQQWYPQLLELLIEEPRDLGEKHHLLRQGRSRHTNPGVLRLHAWLLSSSHIKRQAFLTKQRTKWRDPSENPPEEYISQNGNSFVVGVLKGVQIHSRPLYPL